MAGRKYCIFIVTIGVRNNNHTGEGRRKRGEQLTVPLIEATEVISLR